MKAIQTTYSLAMAVGRDAANRLQRKNNLSKWDEECAQLAAKTFSDLYDNPCLDTTALKESASAK